MSTEWFILQYKANSHDQAVKNLNRQGFETFLPLIDITSQKVSKFISDTQPLFPGYMFVKFDRTKSEWHKINSTYGVSRLVTFNAILKSISATFVNSLINRCDSSGKLLPVKELKEGDRVKVLKGPFANFFATIETFETEKRIWILMDLMGRKTKIQASSDVLKISN